VFMAKHYAAGAERWDAAAQVPYLSVDKPGAADDLFATYENPRSIAAKIAFVKATGYGGWIVWDISADYFPEATTPAGKHPLAEAIRVAREAEGETQKGQP
jgi:chitinase